MGDKIHRNDDNVTDRCYNWHVKVRHKEESKKRTNAKKSKKGTQIIIFEKFHEVLFCGLETIEEEEEAKELQSSQPWIRKK